MSALGKAGYRTLRKMAKELVGGKFAVSNAVANAANVVVWALPVQMCHYSTHQLQRWCVAARLLYPTQHREGKIEIEARYLLALYLLAERRAVSPRRFRRMLDSADGYCLGTDDRRVVDQLARCGLA